MQQLHVTFRKSATDVFNLRYALLELGWFFSRRSDFLQWPTTVTAKQKVTAKQTLLTAKQN